MTGIDYEVFNARERPISSDYIDIQTMTGRVVADLLGYEASSEYPITGVSSDSVRYPRNYVHGLRVQSIATNLSAVQVGLGYVVQYSNTLSPTPGAHDSPFRLGFNRAVKIVTLPVPGVNKYYLLEAQVSRVAVETATRDILDPVSGKFVPTNVTKKYEYQITTQWTAGTPTTVPAPSGGDWVALAAVYVFAAGTVSGTTAADVIDVRPTRVSINKSQFQTGRSPVVSRLESAATPTVASTAAYIAIDEAWSSQPNNSTLHGGIRLDLLPSGPTALDLDSNILEFGLTLAEYTWYYLYMCPWNDLAPEYINTDIRGHGIPVISANPPDAHGMNASQITLGGVWSSTVPVGVAPCCGALHRNGSPAAPGFGNTGWTPSRGAHGRVDFYYDLLPSQELLIAFNAAAAAGAKTITVPYSRSATVSPGMPKCARSMRLRVSFSQTSAAGNNSFVVTFRRPGGGTTWRLAYVAALASYAGQLQPIDFDVPVPAGGENLELNITAAGAQLVDAVNVYLLGYQM